jgi:chloramphenicol-sensitive protein RarD
VAIPSLPGLYIETVILMPLALVYWIYLTTIQSSAFVWSLDATTSWLLILAGPVTVLPLLAFNSAATRLRLSTIGYFQYLAPTINLVLAILIYNEPLTQEKLITFSLIWSALLLVSVETYLKRTKRQKG